MADNDAMSTGPSPASNGSITDADNPATASINRWALHRRLYEWVLSFAHHKHSTTALFVLSFAESSFFPIPPDVLLMPLAMARRSRAWWFATVCTIASVLGGMFGYLIGWGFWQILKDVCFTFLFSEEKFNTVTRLYQDWDFWVVFLAGFTPLPYKIFTIAGGVMEISFPMLVIASIVGRGGRFYLVAALMWKFGAPVKTFIERYFNWLCLLFAVLLVGGFALIKFLH